jgi:HEAT repeat protein
MKDEESVAALIEALEHPEKPVIRAAVDALARAAAESATLSARLNALLGDSQRKNRWAVAYVLAQLPSPSNAVIAVLLDGLDHPHADIRWAIGLLLVRLAKESRPLAEALLRLCSRGAPTQRRLAVYCIRDLNLQDRATRRALLSALHDQDPLVRIAAAGSLRRVVELGRCDYDALLRTFLEDPDTRVRGVAALTLAQKGYATNQFFEALEKEANSGNEQTGRAARTALDLLKNTRAAPSDK